ncbi:cytochrome D ubiquinol oxidase subunit I [Undibacterium sp. FT137W]|uniref:Cytochrome D ubiquinol oxidase subunit I n=2 Tax=Undibacterium fentianense TaxID=2828728 RepID=A0A941E7Y9_9BURK|nr:cytochrome D ubiquinol oxidase subunit I [Undibacterium fentianense]
MLDDMFDYMQHIRERPVWQPVPEGIRQRYHESLPREGVALEEIHQRFLHEVMPYSAGNAHPGFMGWVQGGGTPVGMLAELLAAGLNANLGGRDQMPVEVEKQMTRWMQELFQFPDSASGLFVTGTSIANFIAVLIARAKALGLASRKTGIASNPQRLVAYASVGAHACVSQAIDMAGIGTDALRLIPVNENFEMDLDCLRQAIQADRLAGMTPFMIAGTAGTVDVGAIDNLSALADFAESEELWFHIDGAFGALAMLAKDIAPRLKGIERADSIAFDFHKWLQVPYDAGYILVRDGDAHFDTFAISTSYLKRETRGIAAGTKWPCDFGPDLSRGFRALKAWFTIQVYGTERLGKMISHTCEVARYLQRQIEGNPRLELLAPVNLNIVCFRYLHENQTQLDDLNRDIVFELHESGLAAPSTTRVHGHLAIRAAIVNHRTGKHEIDRMLRAVIQFGDRLSVDISANPA